ncbi:hypothetical protein BBJ28_00010873 [Nothophytophthora sp. Chile5]|nr:hypothetical protein BBJ28_00010873 [Nothophytophthora sp. Chile5]
MTGAHGRRRGGTRDSPARWLCLLTMRLAGRSSVPSSCNGPPSSSKAKQQRRKHQKRSRRVLRATLWLQKVQARLLGRCVPSGIASEPRSRPIESTKTAGFEVQTDWKLQKAVLSVTEVVVEEQPSPELVVPTIPKLQNLQEAVERDGDDGIDVPLPAKPSEEDDPMAVSTDDLGKLVASLEDGATLRAAEDGELRLNSFLTTCRLICDFLSAFGRATAFAGSAVFGYISSIDTNLKAWLTSSKEWKERSVKAIIEREVELQVADVGGRKTPSCSRCVLRLLWFVEFVESCIRLMLLDSKDENCARGAAQAYQETVGQHHPWLVRKGVEAALSAAPTRNSILEELRLRDDGEEGLKQLRKAHGGLKEIVEELRSVFKKHELLDIK